MMRLTQPTLDYREMEAVSEVLESGFLTQGERAMQFETLVANQTGAKFALAVSSCTTALHLCMEVMNVGRGDEVIVPDFTFPATANVVVQQGATPVLVDIDQQSFCMDPEALEQHITPRTRAIIPVHAFGLCADMDAIKEVAKRHAIHVIEDAACALGSTYKGANAGSLADAACFSFHPRKIITTGEGGMITTSSGGTIERARLLASHGGQRQANYLSFDAAGFNYRLSDIQAAIGLIQMTRLDGILAARRSLAATYDELLSGIEGVSPPRAPEKYGHAYQSYVVMVGAEFSRDAVISLLKLDGIETTLGTYSLHCQPFFREAFGYTCGQLPRAKNAFQQSLTLPLHPAMQISDLEFVVERLGKRMHESRKS